MRAPISLVLALGLGVVSPVARAAEPAPSPEVRAVQLQTLFTEAQLHVDRYNSTRDSKHLVVARELLAQWLVDHRALYGDSKEAIAQRSTIEQQLGMIDAELEHLSSAGTVAPAPAPAPMPAPVMVDEERAPSVDPRRVEAQRQAQRWTRGGGAVLTLGLLTVVGASLPLWGLRNSALRRADEQTFRVDQERYFERAQRRQVGAIATLAVGAPLAALGVAMITVELVKRSQARQLTLMPEAGVGYAGAGLRLRF